MTFSWESLYHCLYQWRRAQWSQAPQQFHFSLISFQRNSSLDITILRLLEPAAAAERLKYFIWNSFYFLKYSLTDCCCVDHGAYLADRGHVCSYWGRHWRFQQRLDTHSLTPCHHNSACLINISPDFEILWRPVECMYLKLFAIAWKVLNSLTF